MKAKKLLNEILYIVIALGIILSVWSLIALSVNSEFIVPSIPQSIDDIAAVFSDDELYVSLGNTMLRSIIGFLFSFTLACICVLISKLGYGAKRVIALLISVLRSIPSMSLILLFIIWSPSNLTPIWVASLVAFPTMFSGLTSASDNIDRNLILATRTFDVALPIKIFKIYIPLMAPISLESMANAISIGTKVVIASEVLAQTSDALGSLMQESRIYFEVGKLMIYTVLAVMISLILEYAIRLIKKIFFTY